MANLDIGAADALAKFAAEVEPLDPGAAQSTYTHTFDLAPSCSPYLGAHLFDEESRDRARLMVGLRMTYRRAGIDLDDRELPDHISLVLDCAPSFEEEEWCDLGRLILVPALKKMEEILRPTTNPWRHLFGAARRLAETTFADGGAL